MSTIPAFTLDYVVRGFDCGYGGPFRVLSICNFLQEAAGLHAAQLGWGMDDLKAQGKTWMLSRLELRVDALPSAGDGVQVSTWPAGAQKLFALRDFEMTGAEGKSLIRAVYAYLVVDLERRRPVRPGLLFDPAIYGEEGPRGPKPQPIADLDFTLPAAVGLVDSLRQTAAPRHIDENGHVNNAFLVDWLVDAVPKSQRGTGELRSLRIEFRSETLESEELSSSWGIPSSAASVAAGSPDGVSDGLISELRRGGDVVARAWSRWSSR